MYTHDHAPRSPHACTRVWTHAHKCTTHASTQMSLHIYTHVYAHVYTQLHAKMYCTHVSIRMATCMSTHMSTHVSRLCLHTACIHVDTPCLCHCVGGECSRMFCAHVLEANVLECSVPQCGRRMFARISRPRTGARRRRRDGITLSTP